MRGWSVLTRPSRISGEPVTAATEVAGTRALEVAQRAPGGEDLEAQLGEAARDHVDAVLLRDRDEGAPALVGHEVGTVGSGRRLGLGSLVLIEISPPKDSPAGRFRGLAGAVTPPELHDPIGIERGPTKRITASRFEPNQA